MSAVIKEYEVNFEKKLTGYDKQQVDSYINTLSQAYQKAYTEYCSIKKRYAELLREYDLLEKQITRNRPNSEYIKSIIADAEIMAENIIISAQSEASKIIADTAREVQKIKSGY